MNKLFLVDYIPIRTTSSGAHSPSAGDYSPRKPRDSSGGDYGRARDPSTDSQPPRTPGHLKPVTFEQLDRPATPLLDQHQQQSVGYQPYDQPPPRPPLPNHVSEQGMNFSLTINHVILPVNLLRLEVLGYIKDCSIIFFFFFLNFPPPQMKMLFCIWNVLIGSHKWWSA